jgi:hypothetical protein
MIQPACFGFNEQTAGSNSFQQKTGGMTAEYIHALALKEFKQLETLLKKHTIDVVTIEDTDSPATPDAIFPNNWISFHENNTIVLYPMLAENRRKERRTDILGRFMKEHGRLIDLSPRELNQVYLEGTGSIVFDYENRLAYANISTRTNKTTLLELCGRLDYKPVTFKAVDEAGQDIYHTNVLMCIGKGFAVICADCIPEIREKEMVKRSLETTGHEVIEISYQQMNQFAGNMYQLFNKDGKSFIVMSEQAFLALDGLQVSRLENYGKILHSPLYTIEKYGGGSARCMMAEVR